MVHLASKLLIGLNCIILKLIKTILERHRKLKKAEMLRQLDAERQLEEEAAAKEEPPRPAISRGKSRDVERGIN